MPVLDLHGDGLFVGLSDSGDWVIESVNGLVPLTSEVSLDSLLTCLYHPRQEILDRLVTGVKAIGLPEPLAESFPFVELVAYALGFSPFYADIALEWIEDGPRRDIFLPPLADLAGADDILFSRQVRHRANALIRRIRREQTEQP